MREPILGGCCHIVVGHGWVCVCGCVGVWVWMEVDESSTSEWNGSVVLVEKWMAGSCIEDSTHVTVLAKGEGTTGQGPKTTQASEEEKM